jgi:hypothetical protein
MPLRVVIVADAHSTQVRPHVVGPFTRLMGMTLQRRATLSANR